MSVFFFFFIKELLYRILTSYCHVLYHQKQNSDIPCIILLALLGQYSSGHKQNDLISNKSVVPGHFSLEAVVDGYPATVVQLYSNVLETEAICERAPADTHQQHVTSERLVLASSSSLHSENILYQQRFTVNPTNVKFITECRLNYNYSHFNLAEDKSGQTIHAGD